MLGYLLPFNISLRNHKQWLRQKLETMQFKLEVLNLSEI